MHLYVLIFILAPSKRYRKMMKKIAVIAVRFVINVIKNRIKNWY